MTKMRTAGKVAILIAVMIAGVSSQGICFPVKVMDDRSKEIVIPVRPQRIISLAPTNTELLFDLGLEKEIVGVSSYCDYPAAARLKEKVGGFLDVNEDRIVALKPDVILAFGTAQLPVVEALEKRGLKVFWLYPHTMNDILNSFERVGRITGTEPQAKQLRNAVEKDINALRSTLGAIPEEKRPTVFRVMDFNRTATIGAESFQTDLFSLAGGRNVFPAAGKDYVEMDAQELRKLDPAVILVCGDDEKALKQQLRESPLYKDLTAVRNDAVLVMPCELTCRPGPRIAVTARRMAQYLHPDTKVMDRVIVSSETGTRPIQEKAGGCGCAAGQ